MFVHSCCCIFIFVMSGFVGKEINPNIYFQMHLKTDLNKKKSYFISFLPIPYFWPKCEVGLLFSFSLAVIYFFSLCWLKWPRPIIPSARSATRRSAAAFLCPIVTWNSTSSTTSCIRTGLRLCVHQLTLRDLAASVSFPKALLVLYKPSRQRCVLPFPHARVLQSCTQPPPQP